MTCSTFSLYTASAIPVVRSPAASEVERQTWRLMMHTDSLTVYIAEIDGDPVGTATSCLTSAMPSTGPIVSTALGLEPEAEGFRRYLRNVPPAVQAARAS
jgi:hypothetical protein